MLLAWITTSPTSPTSTSSSSSSSSPTLRLHLQLRLQLCLPFYCLFLLCLSAALPPRRPSSPATQRPDCSVRRPNSGLTPPDEASTVIYPESRRNNHKSRSRVEIQKIQSDRLVSVARPSAVKLSSSRIPALPLIAAARSPRPPLLLHHHQPAPAPTATGSSASILTSLPASTLSAPRSQTPFDSSAPSSRPDGWSDAAMASTQAASTASPAAEQPAQAKQPSSFFPLGYKEGFSQWVRLQLLILFSGLFVRC